MDNYRFTLFINQYGALEYNKRNQGKEIDLLDIILLTEIKSLIDEWTTIEKINIRNKEFFWIAYSKIIDELPLLGITTTDGIGKRLKKLIVFGLLEKETLQTGKENRKTYFCLTSKGLEVVTLRMEDHNPYGWQTVTPTDGKPHNKNTINKNTKDERESSHFDFLNIIYPEEIEKVKEKYKFDPEQWKFLIDFFNNKKYNQKTITVTTFENVSKNWSNNLKKNINTESETKPHYLSKIS